MMGGYEKQSLIPSLIMFVVHCFTSAYSVCSNVSLEHFLEMDSSEIESFYHWYIYYPTLFLSFFLLGRYADYVFRDSKHKRLLGFLFTMIVGWIILLVFRVAFTLMFFWN